MKSIRDFEVQGKKVLVRCDFNVPLDEGGLISDDFRIQATLPTIEYIQKKKGKLVLMTHLGDPEGKVVQRLKVDGIQKKLAELLGLPVVKAPDCVGKDVEALAAKIAPGEILLLENLRFHKEEEENDRAFSQALSKFGDVYINDAFSVSHRRHASIAGVAEFLPSGIGLLFVRELKTLERFRSNPQRPFLVIVGGKKAENKLAFVDAISPIADKVLLGNLLARENVHHGANPFSSFRNPLKVVLPLDGELDIGPKTLELFTRHIQKAKAIFWTGPLGQIEKKEYAKGSIAIAKAIGESKAFSVAGGGDLVGFLRSFHLEDKFSYISTGGGAALAFLAGETLPGLEALHYYGD